MLYNSVSSSSPGGAGPREGRTPSSTKFARIVALALIVALPSTALAAGSGSWGGHVAWGKISDAQKGNYWVGGQVELRPVPVFGLQGAVDYRTQASYAFTPQMQNAVKVKSIPVTLTGHLYLPMPSSLTPYLLAGAGWYRTAYEFSPQLKQQFGFKDTSVSSFGWHIGAGARFLVVPNLSLSAEARYIFVDPKRKLDKNIQDNIRNLDYNSAYYGLGVNFEF